MATAREARVRAAIVRLNNLYGRGDVGTIRHEMARNGGMFEYRRFACRPQWRRFRIVGQTVYACGHQLTVREGRV